MNELAELTNRLSCPSADPGQRMRKTNQRWLILLGVVVVAALPRIFVAERSGLRPDEVFSVAMATGHSLEHPVAVANPSLGDFVEQDHPLTLKELSYYLKHETPLENPRRVVRAVLLSDTSPPLYYLLLYGWTAIFGTSDMALRLFSIACSLACLPFLVGIARLTGGRAAVLPVCILFALSPIAIYYSSEGRMYALLWFCVLATTWVSFVMRQRGPAIILTTLWILTSAAGFLTHYFFVFPWLAIIAYMVLSPGKLKRLPAAGSVLATALLIVPWYIRLPESFAGWRITKDWLKWRPDDYSGVFVALRDVVFQSFYGYDRHLWFGHRASNLPVFLLFAAIGILMIWRLRMRAFSRGRLLLMLQFAFACAGPLVFDVLQGTYTIAWPRYALSALPAAYLLTAAAFACLRHRTRMVMLCLIVLAWMPNLLLMNLDPVPLPIREVSLGVSANGDPADLILVHSIPSGVLGVARYANNPAAIASWVGQLGNRSVPDSLEQLAAGRKRILFIKFHEVGAPAPEEDWLRAHATVFKEIHWEKAETVDFRPRGSKTF
jgi:4-amino-4-deoxy-L-arabinose transferase-like glycosyltransferase